MAPEAAGVVFLRAWRAGKDLALLQLLFSAHLWNTDTDGEALSVSSCFIRQRAYGSFFSQSQVVLPRNPVCKADVQPE